MTDCRITDLRWFYLSLFLKPLIFFFGIWVLSFVPVLVYCAYPFYWVFSFLTENGEYRVLPEAPSEDKVDEAMRFLLFFVCLCAGTIVAYICATAVFLTFCLLSLSLVFSSLGIVMLSVSVGGNGQLYLLENIVRFIFSLIVGHIGMTQAPLDIRSPAKHQLFILSALIEVPSIYYRYIQMCEFEASRE